MKVDAFGADSDPIATARRLSSFLETGSYKGSRPQSRCRTMAQALKRSFDDILKRTLWI